MKALSLALLALSSSYAFAQSAEMKPEVICRSVDAASDHDLSVTLRSNSYAWMKSLLVEAHRIDGDKVLARENVPLRPRVSVTQRTPGGASFRDVTYESPNQSLLLKEVSRDEKTWILTGQGTLSGKVSAELKCRSVSSPPSQREDAIFAFVLASQEGNAASDRSLLKAKASLERYGFLPSNEVEALLLSSSCGFAGCDDVYVVQRIFQTRGANPRATSLAAIVGVPALGEAKILKVVDPRELR